MFVGLRDKDIHTLLGTGYLYYIFQSFFPIEPLIFRGTCISFMISLNLECNYKANLYFGIK